MSQTFENLPEIYIAVYINLYLIRDVSTLWEPLITTEIPHLGLLKNLHHGIQVTAY